MKVACYGRFTSVYVSDEKKFLSESDVGHQFVRIQPHRRGCDSSFMIDESPSKKIELVEKAIRNAALQLTAYNVDGSMEFTRPGIDYPLDEEWNDGHWMSVEKCIELFKTCIPQ